MKITLFLNKLSHDHSYLVDDQFASTGWIHGMAKPGMEARAPIIRILDPARPDEHLPHITLRKEKWGAFLVHGPTASVYQLDPSASSIFERLKAGESLQRIKENPAALTSDEMATFEDLVKQFNLLDITK